MRAGSSARAVAFKASTALRTFPNTLPPANDRTGGSSGKYQSPYTNIRSPSSAALDGGRGTGGPFCRARPARVEMRSDGGAVPPAVLREAVDDQHGQQHHQERIDRVRAEDHRQ